MIFIVDHHKSFKHYINQLLVIVTFSKDSLKRYNRTNTNSLLVRRAWSARNSRGCCVAKDTTVAMATAEIQITAHHFIVSP